MKWIRLVFSVDVAYVDLAIVPRRNSGEVLLTTMPVLPSKATVAMTVSEIQVPTSTKK